MTKEIGPKHCSKKCFLILAGKDDLEFDLSDGTDKFFIAAILSTRNTPLIQLQINPILKILEDKD